MSYFESQWSSSDKPGKYFTQLLQCADHNQIKRGFARKTPKLGKFSRERCLSDKVNLDCVLLI